MRKLVACLACRNTGTRLYGKPMQNLDVKEGISILQHMINMFKKIEAIDAIVLGIAEGNGNTIFIDVANDNGIPYIIGTEDGVLDRIIRCCYVVGGTDVFRVTTESPYTYFEKIDEAWATHVRDSNDITILDDNVPEGCHFEIIKIEAFDFVKKFGEERHKKDFCTLYFKENLEKFNFYRMPVDNNMRRIKDIRLTVDNPEDLVVCREIYSRLGKDAPMFKLEKIIEIMDQKPHLKELVKQYINPKGFW